MFSFQYPASGVNKMTMRSSFSRIWSLRFFLIALLLFSVSVLSTQSSWSNRGSLVFFTANWCASCRDAEPIVKEVASQNNLSVTEIDVDSADAPKQAHNAGLSIPTESPPQVYFLGHGHTALIYNGSKDPHATGEDVRSALLAKLQKILPQ
jgi:thiol-disulfide isomerase/thioredoxin